MLIEFSGERTGSVVMFGTIATRLLKMMGQSGNEEGAIRADDVPEALKKLKAALDTTPASDNNNQKNDDQDEEEDVSIQTRAVPMINLLEESIAENSYVMWKPQ